MNRFRRNTIRCGLAALAMQPMMPFLHLIDATSVLTLFAALSFVNMLLVVQYLSGEREGG